MKQRSLKDDIVTLKRRLENCQEYPWDGIAAWTHGALPLFTEKLPNHLQDFRNVTTPPKPTIVKMAANLLAAPENSYERISHRNKEIAADQLNCRIAKQGILSFMNGLADALPAEPLVQDEQSKPQVIEDKHEVPLPNTSVSKAGVFISHSSQDKELVNALADLLQLTCDLEQQRIFCSSIEGMGIPNGEDFVSVIKSRIEKAEVVVFVLSQAYFASQFCLTELGASWVLASKPLFLLVPPIGFGDLSGVLRNIQAGRITEPSDLTHFWDEIRKSLALGDKSTSRWEAKRTSFMKSAEQFVAQQMPPVIVKAEDHQAVQQKYDDASQELTKAYEEIKSLEEKVEVLKKVKDPSEVKEVERRFENDNPTVPYMGLRIDAGNALAELPPIVQEVIFRRYKEDIVVPSDLDREELSAAVDDKFLLRHLLDNVVTLNEHDRKVKDAVHALDRLRRFLNEAPSDLHQELENELGYRAELDNKRYWRDVLLKRWPWQQ